MNTNILKIIQCWTLLLCCLLLSSAHAQDAEPRAADNEAPGRTTTFAPASTDERDERSGHSERDDDWSTSSDTDSSEHHYRHHHNRHHGSDDPVISIGRKAELPAGQHADSVIAIFGSATSAGDVDDAVISILGSTRVTGRVGDSAVAVMGSVYVNGEVDGDVVAVMGNIELGPEARVRGDIVVVGGELTRDPKAIVDGHVQSVLDTDWAGFDWLRPWIERCLLYGRPLAFAPGLGWAWGLALGLLALYLFIAFAFRGTVERCVYTLETQPGHSVVAALLSMLIIPVLFVLLFITVLGIAAVPFLAVAILCAALFGKVVVLATIGRRCTPMLAANPVAHTVVGVLVAGLIALVLYTIPVVGFIVFKSLELLGLGVVMYALLIAVRAARQSRAPGGPGPGGSGGSGGGPALAGGPAPAGSVGLGGAAAFGGRTGSAGGATFGADEGSAAEPGFDAGPGFAGGAGVGDAAGFGGRSGPEGAAASSASATPGGIGGLGGTAGLGGGAAGGGGVPPYTTSGSTGQMSPNAASLPRAGFAIRMGALLLDAVLIGILLHQVHEHGNLELLVLAAYGAIMWKLKAATVGGIICGLQVVRLDGRPIDWPTAIVRALGCFLSLAVVGLGFLWIAIDADRQSWHDKIAGTVVVRVPKGLSLL